MKKWYFPPLWRGKPPTDHIGYKVPNQLKKERRRTRKSRRRKTSRRKEPSFEGSCSIVQVRAFFFNISRAGGNLKEAVKEEEGEAAVGTIHPWGTNLGPIQDPSDIIVQHVLVRAFFFTILRASGNLREAVKEEGEAAVGTIHRRGKAAAAYGLLLAKKST